MLHRAARAGAAQDVEELISAMNLDEKASLTAGADNWRTAPVPRLGIRQVKMTDGPNGARGSTGRDGTSLTPSLCIPSASALGATWDPEVVGLASAAVARQAKEKSARILLAPTVNLHRHPLWGRNFEAFSEDPFLSGKLASAYIKAVQEQGVIATVKHLVANESEHERQACSSELDERALRELYLLPFEFAVREGAVRAVMTSYNRVNGKYVADDGRLLEGILRGEWGFNGIVMTDWWALASTVEAAEAGLDIEMPGPGRSFGASLAGAVRQGTVAEACLDDKVRHLLSVFKSVGALDGPVEEVERPSDTGQDRAVARRVAAEAMVLLKNEGRLLPLEAPRLRRVALIGPGVGELSLMGGGSARVVPHYTLSLAEVFAARLPPGTDVVVEHGCELSTGARPAPSSPEGASRAAELAAGADVAIVVVGTNAYWETEGRDRAGMDLPGEQAQLVDQVLRANPNTVVVLNTGAPVALPFAGSAPALLQCWFGGQELANALVDVLLGDAEPGGRLPMTIPERLEHTPAFGNFPAESSVVRYAEGVLLGYRWYQARRLSPLFPFGHGLSYTAMKLGPARASAVKLPPEGALTIEVDVENTGSRLGSEVVQVYVAPPGGGNLVPGGRMKPVKSLKGFAKVRLAPGEKTTVKIALNQRSFAYYDVADTAWQRAVERLGGRGPDGGPGLHRSQAGWYIDAGTYEVEIGRSCEDISERLQVQVESAGPLPASAPLG